MAQSERTAFKDYFSRKAAGMLAAQVSSAWPKFDRKKFVRLACVDLDALEFAGRVQQFSSALAATLPTDVPRALRILTKSLPKPLPTCDQVTDGWLQWPVGQFIADHGLPHFDDSMIAMLALTKRFTSEFAVRPFVEQRPKDTFGRLLALTEDPNPHVRRWCSEGTRPRLPWGKRLRDLVADPSPIWPILEALRDDSELYVRRSVANNMNDIAKDHAALVIRRCRRWIKKAPDERQWVVKRALRTLIKAGDPGALAIVGYGPPKGLSASVSVRPKRIAIGGSVELSAQLDSTSRTAQDLLIDYVVHYVRSGKKSSPKVFKWKTISLAPNASVTIKKQHAMKPTTIRALYPGVHRVELQVNGSRIADTAFRLGPR